MLCLSSQIQYLMSQINTESLVPKTGGSHIDFFYSFQILLKIIYGKKVIIVMKQVGKEFHCSLYGLELLCLMFQ